jgi:hypothetical protein
LLRGKQSKQKQTIENNSKREQIDKESMYGRKHLMFGVLKVIIRTSERFLNRTSAE